MSDLSLSDPSSLYFVIPGFITVWSYRYATYSEKKGEFELLGLSCFWGIFIVGMYAYVLHDKSKLAELFGNPYAAALSLSAIGSLFAFVIAVSIGRKNRITDLWSRIKHDWLVFFGKRQNYKDTGKK